MAGEREDEGETGAGNEPLDATESAAREEALASEPEAPKEPEQEASEDVAAKAETNAPDAKPTRHQAAKGASFALPFVRLERAWTFVESRLLFVLLLLLVLSMVAWVSLRGLAAPLGTDSYAGVVFRALFGATVLGSIAYVVSGRGSSMTALHRALITTGSAVVGVAIAPLWRSVGVAHFDGILNWLQEGSNMMMLGGLRGVSTRLTLLVALFGASLAAARSKHINIDVVLRVMRPSFRAPVHVMAALATAAVCFGAAWGFFDYLSIEAFGQKPDAPAMEKIEGVRKASSLHWFAFRKQIGLDLKAFPDVVFRGVRWDAPSRMNGQAWNTWLDEAGFSERFSKEEVAQIRAPESALTEPRVPVVSLPSENTRGILINDSNLMWPFGLLMIGLRVLLRALLVVTGHASVEPDADEPDEDDEAQAQTAGEGA